ncbi:transcriptional regulator SlyA [Kordia sp. SMS9]|uniref:MarR family winged helix-turn-helix transcriptional regulator n=1 Tax=Kordia sp. SMS9 TaxID=2282170 RepID=UPI000E0D7263|nr:MarR family transcriptional regulator [Kordia sp. SMS9]AXG71622.1 transcriptional regulator SlyA [Kordia sp. SMS9]
MNLKSPAETIFYTIESTIKEYRKSSQKKLSNEVSDMTIDQGMILAFLDQYPEKTQKEIASMAFKDNASMTRMLDLMEKKKYLKRSINPENRRRYKIEITAKGKRVLKTLAPIITNNREKALNGISAEELQQVETILLKIKSNCN